ncbi:MAG: hypothetical protein IJG09_03400 [Methanobrevibacter sp.]|jgi:hypothetical protein|nr:hypothetical protein [Methanobrevibacter sp.]MBR3335902.1 hypothetical protein [Bacillus sp. (in: firmicutes)]
MQNIEAIVFEFTGEEVVIAVGESDVTEILYCEEKGSYKVYKTSREDGKQFLSSEVHGVRVVHYDPTGALSNNSNMKKKWLQ